MNRNIFIAILRGIFVATVCFNLVLSILLIANEVQIRRVDPLKTPVLDQLRFQSHENPENNQLPQQIREIDLMARRAYFTHQWQKVTGIRMLLIGILILVLSYKGLQTLGAQKILPDFDTSTPVSWMLQPSSRKWLSVFGVLLIATALVFSLMPDRMSSANTQLKEVVRDFDPERVWPNLRGLQGIGVAAVERAPVEWDGETNTNILWKVEMPLPGHNSPVVWNETVYLSGANRKIQKVFAYDLENGHLKWETEIPRPQGDVNLNSDTGYAPSTLATDGSYVCVIYPTGSLACLNTEGTIVWHHELGIPDNHYGHASSLIMHEGMLFVQWDQNEKSKLVAYDVQTGDIRWQQGRTVISWASPVCVNTRKRTELILVNSETVASYDPQNGKQNWELSCMAGEMGPSAAYANGMVFAANDYAVAVGITLSNKGAEVTWEYDENMPDTASPLATDDYVFLCMSYALVCCLDTKTGQMLWEEEFDDGFYSSPILVGDLIYAVDMQGVTHIFKAAGTYEKMGENSLGERCVSTPAFVQNKIVIRGDKHLFCIE